MKRKVLPLIIVVLYFSPLFSLAQKVDSMMKVYSEKFPQEKLYMQFDKKAYNPGERIWFKAYLFTGFDPSPYSKNLYTELFDAGGTLIQRNVSAISQSTAIGSFELPVNFEGTRIRIRSYTGWMLNFDTSFVYTKDLRVTGVTQDSANHVDQSPVTLHFFPEGGDLIAGVENNIAFMAEDAYGKPHKISGILYEQSGKVLLNFNSTHGGMGKFLLVPEKQDVFYAGWKDDRGIEHRTDLPAVRSSGVSLRVIYAKQKLVFSVARPAESIANEQVTVIAHMNQQMIYKAIVNLKDVFMSGGNIPTDQLPTGILQVTVFDMNVTPLAERVVFINNQNYHFDGKLSISSKSLQKRGRNVLELMLPDSVNCNLSLAITDAEVDGNKAWDDNIITRLLLTGDLQGYIKDPYYYFQNNSDTLTQQLDLIMLTHGWRRFKWEDLRKGKIPVIRYPIENYLSINAEVLGVDVNRIAKDESITVILQNRDSSSKMLDVPMVSNGKFRLGGLIFYDTAKAYYQFNINQKLSREAAVLFKNGLNSGYKKLRPFNNMSLPVWSPEDSSLIRKNMQVFVEAAKLRGLDKVQNLDVVTIRKRVKSEKEKLDEQYASALFSGGNATIFDIQNDVSAYGSIDVFNYLQGRVAGLQITNAGPNPTMQWRGSTPELYLNEMKVDPSALKGTSMSEIAMVKVFAPGAANVMSGGSGGVIAVYTKKGASRPIDPTIKGLEMARIVGYSPVRQFYSPDYLQYPDPASDDIRTTLYWNPNILNNKGNHQFTFSFYNSDVTRHIRIILEGYSDDGRLTHMEKMIE